MSKKFLVGGAVVWRASLFLLMSFGATQAVAAEGAAKATDTGKAKAASAGNSQAETKSGVKEGSQQPTDAVSGKKPAKPAASGPVVEMVTSLGTLRIELDEKSAPVTVKNFLGYVNDKFYDGTVFHRVIKDFMIQGGGFKIEGGKLTEKPTGAPIKNEAQNGLVNDRGTIAMARTSDPDSATAQFFINHVNNNNLNYPKPDGHGYAVFGKVISGLDVLDKIAEVPTGIKSGMQDVPTQDVKIIAVKVVKS